VRATAQVAGRVCVCVCMCMEAHSLVKTGGSCSSCSEKHQKTAVQTTAGRQLHCIDLASMSVQGKGANGHLLAVALAVVAAPGQRPCDHLHHDVQPRPQVIPPAYARNKQLLVDTGGECCLSSAALMTQTLVQWAACSCWALQLQAKTWGSSRRLVKPKAMMMALVVQSTRCLPHVWGVERRGRVLAPRSSPSCAAREA